MRRIFYNISIGHMILGQYSPSFIPILASFIGILSIIACYQIAIYYHHEKPLPNTWISKTAQHYPEFIIFRIGTISNGVLMILSFFFNYFYIITISKEHAFHVKKYKPQITLFFGILGIIALFGNTATIDTGRMNEKWHVTCAGTFFVLTILACLYNTILFWIIYFHIKTVKLSSLVVKTILSLALIIQAYLDVNSGSLDSYENWKSSDLAHYLEFTLAFTLLAYFAIMGLDLKGFKMVYRKVN